jgi:hypothetical protein
MLTVAQLKSKEYYLANREKMLERNRLWKQANPDKVKEIAKKATAKVRSRQSSIQKKETELQRKYKINFNEYTVLYKNQNGICLICSIPLRLLSGDSTNKPANVDHCHRTGKIRGLLCNNCNRGLGHFQDREDLLLNAIGYLRVNS